MKPELSAESLPESTSESAPCTLTQLRQTIDEVDETIAALLAKRQELVKKAASIKQREGEGVVSAVREKGILEHGAQLEGKYHLPPSLMQDLQRRILRQSYKERGDGSFTNAAKAHAQAQHKATEAQSATAAAVATATTPCRVVIVGGNGGMGRFMRRYLEGAAYEVGVVEVADYGVDVDGNAVDDINKSRAAVLLGQADWCIISVPIEVTLKVISQVAPLLRPDCILSDLTSIKEKPVKAMLEVHSGPVLGLHPMFGPDTNSLVKQVVVAVHGRDADKCAFIIEQLKIFGARVVECTGADHDRAMRVIQALRHFTTIVYGNFLRSILHNKQQDQEHTQGQGQQELYDHAADNAFIERLLELSSPIYHLELMMVGRLFAQDPHLYCDIISASSANLELIQKYVSCAFAALEQLKSDDKESFIADFKDTTAFFGKHAQDFLRESSQILALVQDTYRVQ